MSSFTDKGVKKKLISATFKAREVGVSVFTATGGPDKTEITQVMTVKPAPKRYHTIDEVLADKDALRRQAILASVASFFPAFNTASNPDHAPGHKIGEDSKIYRQGAWVDKYAFAAGPDVKETSCTLVNPQVVGRPPSKNNGTGWSFDAAPGGYTDEKTGKWVKVVGNQGWTPCDKDHIPSVGDTYILLNRFQGDYGHVGIILHVPKSGTGLWVTADGGQGTKPSQLGVLIPRWGLMAAMLPQEKPFAPDDNGGPFLSGGTATDIDKNAPMPAQEDDPGRIIKRLRWHYHPENGAKPSNPRKMKGYADVDSPKLTFDVDGKGPNPDHIAACKTLQKKVNDVIQACLGNEVWGAAGT